jgi:hypothetical protein
VPPHYVVVNQQQEVLLFPAMKDPSQVKKEAEQKQ